MNKMNQMKQVKQVKKNQQGIALLLVMGAVTILTAVLATFTFDRNVDEKRAYNMQDRLQARLNAEGGLNLALVRLELYRQALNMYEKKGDMVKQFITKQNLNIIYTVPFMFPIIIDKKNADAIQKSALAEFEKKSIISGGMSVVISNTSQLINVNLLRLKVKKEGDDSESSGGSASADSFASNPTLDAGDVDPKETILGYRKKLIDLLQQKLDGHRDDEDFETKYPTDTPEFLIKCIQYYVSDENSFEDAEKAEIERRFDGARPKFAPMSSLSELYLIPCLKDSIIDLLKEHITVHGKHSLDLNQLTATNLKMLFPDIRDEQIKGFFIYRDDPKNGHPFNSTDDFKTYITGEGAVVDTDTFDKTIGEFQKAGISFGPTGLLFKISSLGKMKDTTYALVATVEIPMKEKAHPKTVKEKEDHTCPFPKLYTPYEDHPGICILKKFAKKSSQQPGPDPVSPGDVPDEKKKEPNEYLEPRLLELNAG